MRDECLQELVNGLFPEAQVALRAFARAEEGVLRTEDLIQAGLTTHRARKALWALRGAGLVTAPQGTTIYLLTENGRRAIRLLPDPPRGAKVNRD